MKPVKYLKMKKRIKTGSLMFCLLFFASINSVAQKISETRYTYHIFNTGSEYEIIQCSIYNSTNEKMLLWFEKDMTIQEMPAKDKVKKYFFSVKGDFSLVNIISEYGSTLTGFKTELFHTFYKIIEPKKIFLIQVICEVPNNNKDVAELLKKITITVTPSQLEKEKLNIFMISGLDQLSFRPNILVVDGQEIHLFQQRGL